TVSQKITVENETSSSLIKNIKSVVAPFISSEHKQLKGEESGRVNILLLGTAGENNPGKNLTDTIMIMSIDTETKKVALLSLPRDLYVNIPDTSYYTKINSVYQYGINSNKGIMPIKKTVEDITNLDIHYFLVMDFEGFKKIIDDIGKINVYVEKDIYDSRYPGSNYSYEIFEIEKGLHKMNGEIALKYARERHADSEGDFGRAKRQQQIIQSVKNKVFSLKTFLNAFTLNKILNTLEKHIRINVQLNEIDSFIWWSKRVDSQNITNAVVDAWKKDSLLRVSHIYYGDTRVFILVPRVGNYSEIQDLAENIFNLDEIKRRQAEIEKEEASVSIINQSDDDMLSSKIRTLLKDNWGINKVTIIGNNDNIVRSQTVVLEKTSGEKIFTLDELVKKLPARLSSPESLADGGQARLSSPESLADGGQAKLNEDKNDIMDIENNTDFVILLGTDLENIYKYGEDTIEDLNNTGLDQMYLNLLENK
ncbi:MAG TPA: hypothetical protein ENG89_01760, partial [Candidatus Moranbacteria bacterium]|nr:hypothetical protein [Candidatus Moranbacteria bacterium]